MSFLFPLIFLDEDHDQLSNYKGVYITAPGTPGLIIIYMFIEDNCGNGNPFLFRSTKSDLSNDLPWGHTTCTLFKAFIIKQ